MANALLIDHEYCTGCRSCEIACRNAHEDTIGSQQWGIHVHEAGPWTLSDNKWDWESGTVVEMAKGAEELGRNGVLFVPRVLGA